MKCANCGAELKVGCVYCSVCGKEAQIVSDYTVLEDDFLRDILKEKKQKTQKKHSSGKQSEGAKASGKHKPRRKKKNLAWAFAAMAILAVLLVGIAFLVKYSQDNSYEYQLTKAESYKDGKDYQQAEKCLKRALELDGPVEDIKMSLVEVYLLQEEEGSAQKLLLEIIADNGSHLEAYRQLIQIYDEAEDYEAIDALRKEITDSNILELFEEYLAEPPEFEPESGTFQEETPITLTSKGDCAIYYTTDGSDPREGKLYHGPIPLEPGKSLKVRAVCCNEFGLYSEENQGQFLLELQKPDTPQVTPSGGSFNIPQPITVDVPDGCKVYYTWGRAAPTQESNQYEGAISMPEGNNILSLILVDEYGMVSDVLKCNYIYIP